MPADTIDVGRTGANGEEVFIAVPDGCYEAVRLPISGATKHAVRFSEAEAAWLIGALKKELRGRRAST